MNMINKEKTQDYIMDEDLVLAEQLAFIKMIAQMKEMHTANRPVVTALEFLEECVRNRIVVVEDNG